MTLGWNRPSSPGGARTGRSQPRELSDSKTRSHILMNLLHKRQQHVLQVGSLLQEPDPTQAVAVCLTDLKLNLKTMDFLTIWIHLGMFRHALEDSLIFGLEHGITPSREQRNSRRRLDHLEPQNTKSTAICIYQAFQRSWPALPSSSF